jgi:DNA mismatch endonuclease (patch repair protein)
MRPSPKSSSSSPSRLPYPHPTTPAVTAAMKGNRRVDTRPELALRSELHRRGLRFRKEVALRPAQRLRRVDIVFPAAMLAVFIDGCFWHGCPEHGNRPKANTDYWSVKLMRNVRRDAEINAELEAAGWAVIRVWEHEDVREAARRVEREYRRLRLHESVATHRDERS